MQPKTILNFVDGDWKAPQQNKLFSKLNPYTQEVLSYVADTQPLDMAMAIQACKKASLDFAKCNLSEKFEYLHKISTFIEQHKAEIALDEAYDQGLSWQFTLKNNIESVTKIINHNVLSTQSEVYHQVDRAPLGVVVIYSAWSLSLRNIFERLAPAFIAGNGVIVKISKHSPSSGYWLGRILQSVEVPKSLIQVLHGEDEQILQMLAAHPAIKSLVYAGSSARATSLINASHNNLKRIQLSLNSKNSCLLLKELDLPACFKAVSESFLLGQGQLNWNMHVLYAQEEQTKEYLHLYTELLNRLKPAESPEDDSLWTPLISANKKDSYSKAILALKAEGAKIQSTSTNVSSNKGFFVSPALVVDLNHCSPAQLDSLQGPVQILNEVKYQHEMVKWVNTGYLSHSVCIWGPADKAVKLGSQLEVPLVWTNGWMQDYCQVIGNKQSSYGIVDSLLPSSVLFSDVKKMSVL